MKKSEMKKLVGHAYFGSVDEMTPRDICMSYLSKHGWRVITFGDGGNGNKTIELLNLNDFSCGKQSFAYKKQALTVCCDKCKFKRRKLYAVSCS